MHNDGILLIVNELGMHKTTKRERVCLQSEKAPVGWYFPFLLSHIIKNIKLSK